MNRRFVAVTLVFCLGAGSSLFAEEGLLQSASRAIQAVEREQGLVPTSTAIASRPLPFRLDAAREAKQSEGGMSNVSKSGLPKITKAMIYIAIGAGFAGAAFAIDGKVVDITPSHLGTRKDQCKVPLFGCSGN